jgi:hypothetical protein
VAIFSRYSSGGMSADSLKERRGALRSMRGSLRPQRPGVTPRAPTPAVDVEEKRTALQSLRQQRGGAPAVQPPAPTSPARTSTTSTSSPQQSTGRAGAMAAPGRSGIQRAPPGMGEIERQPRPPTQFQGAIPAAVEEQRFNDELSRSLVDEPPDPVSDLSARQRRDAKLREKSAAARREVLADFDPFDVHDVRRQQGEDIRLAEEDWTARLAEARMNAENTASLGGMGLSGAASALVSDTERQGAREKAQAISDLRRGQRQELTQTVIDRANLIDAEAALGEDLNDDGKIASGKADEDPNKRDAQDEIVNRLAGYDHAVGDADTEAGTREEPLSATTAQLQQLREAGLRLEPAFTLGYNPDTGYGLQVYSDQFGRYFVERG